jgi:menaquinone-dependent protoporphyrinogen oxidase
MSSILVCYGTTEGQTAKIAGRIADGLRERGHTVETVDLSTADPTDPTGYDAVLVGASIHVGSHQSAVRSFVDTHRETLAARPTGFFQVCLSVVADDDATQAEAARYVDEFIQATAWQPDRIAVFGGALRYSKYGFLKRQVLKRIAKDMTGDTDASRDYEYTDWEAVARFAADFADFVEGEREPVESTPTGGPDRD